MRRVLDETTEAPERLRQLPAAAEILLAAGDVEAARAACDELAELASGHDVGVLAGIVGQARGAVALAAADPGAALLALRPAWRVWEEAEAPYEAARVRALMAQACRALGDDYAADLDATKDDIADYLEAYAQRFELPVITGAGVDRLRRDGDRYVVRSGAHQFLADNVVVASGTFQEPIVPEFARDLDPSIAQMHSDHYRNPSQLAAGPVLVVGCSHSGADIALEVAAAHPTVLSGEGAR